MKQSKAKIYLADERGVNQTRWSRSLNTFNSGNYFNEHKTPFGDIYVVSDDSLDAGHSLHITMEEYSYVVLLPVMGAIRYKDSSGSDNLIAAGQIETLTINKNEKIEIRNPFSDGLINFLQIRIRAGALEKDKRADLSTYNVNQHLNELIKISSDTIGGLPLSFSISIGKFSGRAEATYELKDKNAGLFVFVIEGVFEVQGRLLHARDALALREIEEVKMEALTQQILN